MYQIKINNIHDKSQEFVNQWIPTIKNNDFEYKKEAHFAILENMLICASNLNIHNTQSDVAYYEPRAYYLHQQKQYLGAIVAVNNKKEETVILLFELQWEDVNECDKWNRMLRDRHGENLTLKIKCEMVDEDAFEDFDEDKEDINEVMGYYYEGATTDGPSRYYHTAEEAYNGANDYMNMLTLY